MIVEYTWDNIKLLEPEMPHSARDSEDVQKKCRKILCGRADKDFENNVFPIGLGYFLLRPQDKSDNLTIEEIIVHETVHQLIYLIAGSKASWNLDKMVFNRTYIDGDRVYIQKNKIVL